jgi:hypothetical protein
MDITEDGEVWALAWPIDLIDFFRKLLRRTRNLTVSLSIGCVKER